MSEYLEALLKVSVANSSLADAFEAGKIPGLGNDVMQVVRKNGWNHNNLNDITTTFNRYLGIYWKWNGSVPGSRDPAAGILLGTHSESECQVAAYAFMFLLSAPKPFGLGIPEEMLKVETYTGKIAEYKTYLPGVPSGITLVDANIGGFESVYNYKDNIKDQKIVIKNNIKGFVSSHNSRGHGDVTSRLADLVELSVIADAVEIVIAKRTVIGKDRHTGCITG